MPPREHDEYRATPDPAASITDCGIFQAVGDATLAGERLTPAPEMDNFGGVDNFGAIDFQLYVCVRLLMRSKQT